MDTNTQPKQPGLAGNISDKAPDPFANTSDTSKETKLLVEKIEQRESGVVPTPVPVVQPKKVIKKETFLERLLENAGMKAPQQPAQARVPQAIQPQPQTKTFLPKRDFKKFTRGFLLVLILLVLCFGGYLFIFLTNIDAQLVKITFSGKVTNIADGKPIENTEIFLDNNSSTKTDSNGNYSIKIDKLTFNFKAAAKDYNDFEESVIVPRTILSYSFKKDITLTSSKVAVVSGKFVTENTSYRFVDDKLFFNDEEFVLNQDGSFQLTKVPTGKVKLTFESANFKDISQEITLNSGSNTIKEIKLTPAGDAVGSVSSYVREDIVSKTKFSIENVLDNQILITDLGKFRIRDLDIGRTYKIRSMADGYKSRDYEITIKQGDNELFGFKMVEDGVATYIGSENRDNHFYASDLDGTNIKVLDTIKGFEPKNEYYDSQTGLLYFLSQHDKVRNISKTILIAYSINPATNELKRLTTSNLDSIDALMPNFKAKKMISNIQIRNDSQRRRNLNIMDITGENVKALRTVAENINFDNIQISGNGKYVFFREGNFNRNSTEVPVLYRADSQSDQLIKIVQRKDVQLHTVSEDGNWVVYSALNEVNNLRDLFLFNASTNETRTIKENHDGSQYQFLNQNGDLLLFMAKRDGKMDIYSYSISTNSTKRITNLAQDDEIKNFYQQDKYAFYITKIGLYVIDIAKPFSFKLVTDKVTSYSN